MVETLPRSILGAPHPYSYFRFFSIFHCPPYNCLTSHYPTANRLGNADDYLIVSLPADSGPNPLWPKGAHLLARFDPPEFWRARFRITSLASQSQQNGARGTRERPALPAKPALATHSGNPCIHCPSRRRHTTSSGVDPTQIHHGP